MAKFLVSSEDQKPVITGKEWGFVLIFGVLILILTSIPYIYAQVSTPDDKVFMGIMLDVPDHTQYFSWMRELTFSNLAANKLTPEPNKPVFFNLLWWGLGRLGEFLGLGFAGTFQILRVVSTIIFFIFLYRICSHYFSEKKKRIVSFLVICLTSGLGWVLIVLKYISPNRELLFPLDVFIAEGNTFLCILGYPHFIAALFYIFVFDLILIGESKKSLKYAVAAGLFALFLGWQHAYDLISVYGILGAYGLLKWLRDRKLPVFLLKSGLLVLVLSFWPALYSVLLTSLDPIWKDVLAQFDNAGVFTPNIFHLPILLGFPFLFAVVTVILEKPLKLHKKNDIELFILGWFGISFILVYLPVDYQIHLINGWQIPIGLLTTMGFYKYVFPLFHTKPGLIRKLFLEGKLALPLLILIIVPTNLYLFAWRFVDLARHDYPFYLDKEDLDALIWLDSVAEPDDVVLSSLTIGQFIPVYTGSHAYLAHWAQTIDYFNKVESVDAFFAEGVDDAEKEKILKEKSVDYVYWGSVEKTIGGFDPNSAVFLKPIYNSENVKIFEVLREN